MINVIGDIAGEYDALMRLMDVLPKRKTILVGDLNDRGPDSRNVIEWAMNTPDVVTLHSNHGDMFVDFVKQIVDPDYERRYDVEDFFRNGGIATLRSYGAELGQPLWKIAHKIPMEHINWLASRPLIYDGDDIVCSHAPLPPGIDLGRLQFADRATKEMIVWNREEPEKRQQFQVFGHNSHWGIRSFPTWALCIDSSRTRRLTGFSWPEQRMYSVSYDVEKEATA
jgi:hypothetical protein